MFNCLQARTLTCALIALVFALEPARAFVPSSHMILGRVARASGKGVYAIEQEVQFRTEMDPIVLRERWIIENGDSMRLFVSGQKGSQESWRLDAFYRDGKRISSDGTQIVTAPASSEFIEPIHHFRSAGNIVNWLGRMRIVPAEIARSLGQTRTINRKTSPYAPEPGVRLARAGGVVTWAFGEPSPPQGALNPGLWIDQDAFQFRRLRFPSQADVQADRHASFPNGLRLPRERTVTWDNRSALIRVLSVKSLPDNAATQALLSPAALSAEGRIAPMKLPEATQVREFYSRFR